MNNTKDDHMANRIKLLRSEQKLSQEKVAKKLDMKIDTYRSIENGRRVGRIDTLVCISKFYGVTLDYLVCGKSDLDSDILAFLSGFDTEQKELAFKLLKAILEVLN